MIETPAERLPFDDAGFDTVVATLVLCTVDDPERALSEIARVLRPGGRLLFLEHVRAETPGLARAQDLLHGPWYFLGHGCHCNRDTVAAIRASASRSMTCNGARSRRRHRSSGRWSGARRGQGRGRIRLRAEPRRAARRSRGRESHEEETQMPQFILLTKLTTDGVKTIKNNPARIAEVNSEMEQIGLKVLHQWATLGAYDFVTSSRRPTRRRWRGPRSSSARAGRRRTTP